MKLLSFGEVLFDVFEKDALIGGAPLNFAAHAAIQGADAYLLSAVGRDDYGKMAIAETEKLGVKTDYIAVTEVCETGKCLVSLDEKGVPSYNLLENVAYDHILCPEKLPADFDVFAFGTLALRGRDNIETVQKILAENDFSYVYSDLNIRPPFYSAESILFCMENATIVKISDEELPVITDAVFGKKLEIKDAREALCDKFSQLSLVIITCGEKGAYAWCCGEISFCDAKKTTVESTVGAGDSFGATFLCEYLSSKDIKKALSKASEVSSYVVSQKGAVPSGMKEFFEKLV